MSDKIFLKDITLPIVETGENETYSFVQTDSDLETAGDAADAKKTGDEITQLKEDLTQLDGKIAATQITNTASGAIASFPDGADGVPVKDLVAQIVPVQEGTGDPSPENERPISGWTGANIHRTGKNLFDKTDLYKNGANKYLKPNGEDVTPSSGIEWRVSAPIPVKGGQTYTISNMQSSSSSTPALRWYAEVGGISGVSYGSSTTTKTVIAPDNAVAVRISVEYSLLDVCQFEEGETATSYEPYRETDEKEISWQTEAGTVYGGTLDVTSGVLTVDKKSVTLNEDSNWTMLVEGKFFCPAIPANEASSTTAGAGYLCNQYLVAGNGDSVSTHVVQDKRVYGQRQYGRFWVYDSAYLTLEAFQTALESNALQIVYPLTTPITIQLDPVTIATLLGLNNIWADCGDTTVEYRADTKLYIENLTAPSEDDMTANTNIPDATYFMVGNTLYLSTTTIPAGDTINPGTNCTLMNLAAALNAINS